MTSSLQIHVSSRNSEPATLIEPADSGYILIAADVDQRLPFLPPSRDKRTLLSDCRILCRALERRAHVIDAAVFSALPALPGRGWPAKRGPDGRGAGFDVVMLIETDSIQAARDLEASEAFTYLVGLVRGAARNFRIVIAENVRRIGPVDHGRAGVFLFNFLRAGDIERGIVAWEHAAGWFQQETGLDNGTLLRPASESDIGYTLINHCRWDGLLDIIPSVLLKPSFRSRVLRNHEAAGIVMMPMLYRRE